MAEDPQPMTLQQRIAALNASHIGRVPGEPPLPVLRAKPVVQVEKPPPARSQSVNIPYEQVNGTVTDRRVGNQPNGPPPLPSRKHQPPPLPDRKSSEDSNSRRSSVASIASVSTNGTSRALLVASRGKSEEHGPRNMAPAWGASELPALPDKKVQPPRRPSVPERPKYTSRSSQQSIASQRSVSSQPTVSKQALPPPLPGRKVSVDSTVSAPELPVRRLPPVPTNASLQLIKKSAFNLPAPEPEAQEEEEQPPPRPQRPTSTSHAVSQPPPVPHASRPDLASIQATKPRPPAAHASNGPYQVSQASTNECLTCRDFSGPDNHAARFPRQTVTSLQVLAQQLTAPFPSLTDKARAIFTWLHHNVSYDVNSFFAGNVKPSTPQSTLQSGLAVCEGYAALFANLATYAGLEAVVISGHGKGYGHTTLRPGDPIPPYKAGHAWNAVKIDDGEWKLVDPCWGAGHVQGAGMPYVPHFNPSQFAMSNEEFGIRHFPSNKDQFFLPGGRRLSWEEYIQINHETWPYHCEPPTIFSNAKEDHDIGERTVLPRDRKIPVRSQNVIRFQFGLICPHWALEKHTRKGPPPLFLLGIHGLDGRNEDHIPLERVKGTVPGGGGDLWYADVPAQELGAPGQTLTLFAVATFGERQNCRGLTAHEFRQGKGRVGMSFVGIAAWDLV